MKTLSLILACIPFFAHAKLVTKDIEYKEGATTLQGYLAYDDAATGKRPGIVVVHEWTGLGAYAKHRADMLAQLGYVALAADIYGKGVRAKNPQEAGKLAGKYKGDRKLLRARAMAALDTLKAQPQVDTTRLAAMGYCFGGTTALELARAGAPLKSVVTFHGGLDSPTPADMKNFKGKLLVLHGADDPNVPPEQVAAFQKEVRDAGIDWRMTYFGGAVHAFTNPEAGNDNSKGAAYNERADKRSWEDMKRFFDETL